MSSLTLHWNHGTYVFKSPTGDFQYTARLERKLTAHTHLVNAGYSGGELDNTVLLKLARDPEEIAALEQEASIYQNELKNLQGQYVPNFYGIYHGAVDKCPVACILMEYCTPGNITIPYDEMNRRVMLAACAIHSARIMHCDLVDGKHIVLSGTKVMVVDFSRAVPHRCYGATPTLHPGMGGPTGSPHDCPELMMLEKSYGIFSGGNIPIARPVVNPLAKGNSLSVLARRVMGVMM
ncbi:hypothetical protein DFH06DRAFT_1127472 [Mycena polygramma]|nr:hypothetical protein DFH06DRAFT_1127472 [Mycena polygramma]